MLTDRIKYHECCIRIIKLLDKLTSRIAQHHIDIINGLNVEWYSKRIEIDRAIGERLFNRYVIIIHKYLK